jgi:hypothetical protein
MKYNYDCWDKIFMDKRFSFRLKPGVPMGPCGNKDYITELKKAVKGGLVKPIMIEDVYNHDQ